MGFLEALAVIIKVLPDVVGLIKRLAFITQERAFTDWVKELDDTVKSLETAQSLQDRIAAARKLTDLTRRL